MTCCLSWTHALPRQQVEEVDFLGYLKWHELLTFKQVNSILWNLGLALMEM